MSRLSFRAGIDRLTGQLNEAARIAAVQKDLTVKDAVKAAAQRINLPDKLQKLTKQFNWPDRNAVEAFKSNTCQEQIVRLQSEIKSQWLHATSQVDKLFDGIDGTVGHEVSEIRAASANIRGLTGAARGAARTFIAA